MTPSPNPTRAIDRLLPASLTPDRVRLRVGLVSDTHLPPRLRTLPPALFDALDGADLVLHSGDVGDLTVLDDLSHIAPVVAVHGNDDTPAAQQELPYQLVVAVAGVRILLWHGHYADPGEEHASRRNEELLPKLAWIAARARRAGATVAVFGHWHIPLVYRDGDVLLVNPGALAPSGFTERQVVQTAAALFVDVGRQVHVAHVNLAAPAQPYTPGIDWQQSFTTAFRQFSASTADPQLLGVLARLRRELSGHDLELLRPLANRLGQAVWDGEIERITGPRLRDAVLTDPDLPPDLAARVLRVIESSQSQA